MEKVLLINIDYSAVNRTLEKMNYDTDVFICQGDKIVLSNGRYSSIGKEFQTFDQTGRVGYCQELEFYGMDLDIYVMQPKRQLWTEIRKNLPLIGFLIVVNAILPLLLVRGFNRSFTQRISELSKVFETVGGEHLVPISYVRGKDEIGSLMSNYNRMVARTNELIQIVYKNKIKEQEMLVERQNAELLALHSQINPHFLHNTLNTIRYMAYVQKEENIVTVVDSLSVLLRNNMRANEYLTIEEEAQSLRSYLEIQTFKYSGKYVYTVEVEPGLEQDRILKMLIQPLVENALKHGIAPSDRPGVVKVQMFSDDGMLRVEVVDNGVGMPQEIIEKILNESDDRHIGLQNVIGRIKIYYGAPYGVELHSGGFGTRVALLLPKIEMKKGTEAAEYV